ncbi:mucin-2-like [Daphnia carinata]|uniref:mucin-2-like n=1 Tax=Daphnia carinata TaxID=120202 RepID=UPI00257BC4BB|nr:mucin-2-like [Daphnia carinata]
MRQAFLLLFGFCLVISFTSTGSTTYLKGRDMLRKAVQETPVNANGVTENTGPYRHSQKEKTKNRKNANVVPPPPITVRPLYISRRSTSTIRPSNSFIDWSEHDADTCGGSVNVPLTFDRISLFESSQFLEGRDYPLLCTWNVKASKSCGLARITMRIDGRSRLPDVRGCADGYYAVYPFMKQVRICGRIGDVPPLQWYVDTQQPKNVTIIMENIGLDDGLPEGLSFTLQGECIDDESDEEITNVDKENERLKGRWMKRLVEDFERGEGPRVVKLANPKRRTTTLPSTEPVSSAEATTGHPITTTPDYPSTTATDYPSTTTTDYPSTTTIGHPSTKTRQTLSYDDSGIPWLILKSPDPSPSSIEVSSPIRRLHESAITSRPISPTTARPLHASKHRPRIIPKYPHTDVHITSTSSYVVNPEQSKPVAHKIRPVDTSVTGYSNYSNIPWVILKSPDVIVSMSTSLPYSPNYPSTTMPPTTYETIAPTATQFPSSNVPIIVRTLPTTQPTTQPTTTSTVAPTTTTEPPRTTTEFPTTTTIDVETTSPTSTPQPITPSHETSFYPSLNTQPPTYLIHPHTPATTESITTIPAAVDDASISYISLNGQKFIFNKLQRKFQRTFSKLKQLASS